MGDHSEQLKHPTSLISVFASRMFINTELLHSDSCGDPVSIHYGGHYLPSRETSFQWRFTGGQTVTCFVMPTGGMLLFLSFYSFRFRFLTLTDSYVNCLPVKSV